MRSRRVLLRRGSGIAVRLPVLLLIRRGRALSLTVIPLPVRIVLPLIAVGVRVAVLLTCVGIAVSFC